MATMAMLRPMQWAELSLVEKKIRRVDAGLTFAQEMHLIVRIAFAFVHLTGSYKDALSNQSDLIRMLRDPDLMNWESSDLLKMADKIEHLVSANETVVEGAKAFHFAPWEKLIGQMESQTEALDSLAETLRINADAKFSQYVGDLVQSADETKVTEDSWRDFVATLHD